MPFWHESKKSKALKAVAKCLKMISSQNLFSFDEMKNVSETSMYSCSLTSHATPYHKWVGKFVFYSHLYVSLEWHQTKVSLLLHRVMQIQDSSMNITFIIHTPWLHLYSLLYSYLVAVSAGFHFIISLQVLFHSTNLKWVPCFCPFVLLWIFYFEIIFYFQFSILML